MPASWLRLVLYGFLSYAAVFMLWSFLAAYGMSYGMGAQIAGYAVTALAVYTASKAIGIASMSRALVYGAMWATMHLALDAIYVLPVAGIEAFFTYYAWVGYGIVLLTPLVFFFADMRKDVGISANT